MNTSGPCGHLVMPRPLISAEELLAAKATPVIVTGIDLTDPPVLNAHMHVRNRPHK